MRSQDGGANVNQIFLSKMQQQAFTYLLSNRCKNFTHVQKKYQCTKIEIPYVIVCFFENFDILFSNQVDSKQFLHAIQLIDKVYQFAIFKSVVSLHSMCGNPYAFRS